LHLYADILRESAPESVDSSYVIRMQSQLCKAMHSMGILEHQLHIVNQYSSDVVKAQKDAINAVAEEKTKMELEMMNELVLIDDAKKQVEEECKPKLEKLQLAIVDLRKYLGENNEAASSESESQDELEVEMREGVEELKEAIAEMEDETKEQSKTIESLRAQLKELKMDPDEGQTSQVSHEEEKKMNP
jgi:chromosome segregation ATPase